MRSITTAAAWLVLLCLGFAASAAEIVGTVTDASNNQPLAGASIRVVQFVPNGTSGTGIDRGTVTSGPTGAFQMTLPDGHGFYITVSMPGYVSRTDYRSGTYISVQARLSRIGSIAGVVRNTAGVPQPGVRMRLSFGTSVDTDDLGRYRFDEVAGGNHRVCAHPPAPLVAMCNDGQFFPRNGDDPTPFVLGYGEQRTMDFTLPTGAWVSGIVRDRLTNEPVANADIIVNLHAPGGPAMITNGHFVETDAHGRYVVDGIAPLPFAVSIEGNLPYYSPYLHGAGDCATNCDAADTTATFALGPGERVDGLDFTLFPGAVIRGHARDAATNGPVTGATLSVHVPTGLFGFVHRATTDANGAYEFRHVNPGYGSTLMWASGAIGYVSESANGVHCRESCSGSAVAVPPNAIHTIDFTLDRGQVIGGRISDGARPGRGWVSLFDADGSVAAPIAVQPDGQWISNALDPGTYFVAAQAGTLCRVYPATACPDDDAAMAPTVGAPVTLTAAAPVTGIDLDLPVTVFAHGFE